MKELRIEATHKTPQIIGHIDTGSFSVKGICIPEDARDFFVPVMKWLMEFTGSDAQDIRVEMDLQYFNTSTSSILLDLFKQLQKVSNQKKVSVIWIYEEDDLEMEEVGSDYQLMVGDIFTMRSKKYER